jgi:O-antigen ligase
LAAVGRTILNGLVGLLLAGAFLFPYTGGAVTAYVLIGLSVLLILWNFVRPPRLAADAGSWMFLIGWVMIALAFAITNLPGRTDFLLATNFAMFALYPLLAGALQRFARPGNSVPVAVLALVGAFVALAVSAYQVLGLGQERAEGIASNAIISATAALFIGFFALVGMFTIRSRWRYVFLLGPLAGIGTVLFAGSRGPFLALPALALIGLIMVPVRRVYSLGFAALVVIAGAGAYALKPSVFHRFAVLPGILSDLLTGHPVAQSLDVSGNIRYTILEASIKAFERSPWLGYGWYMKVPVVEKFTAFNVGFGDPRVAHLHSDILNLGVSAGIVGLIAYVLVLLAPIVSAATSPRDTQFRGRLFLAISLSAGFLCCGAVNLLFGFEFMTTLYVVFAAIFIGYCRDAPALAAA